MSKGKEYTIDIGRGWGYKHRKGSLNPPKKIRMIDGKEVKDKKQLKEFEMADIEYELNKKDK